MGTGGVTVEESMRTHLSIVARRSIKKVALAPTPPDAAEGGGDATRVVAMLAPGRLGAL